MWQGVVGGLAAGEECSSGFRLWCQGRPVFADSEHHLIMASVLQRQPGMGHLIRAAGAGSRDHRVQRTKSRTLSTAKSRSAKAQHIKYKFAQASGPCCVLFVYKSKGKLN